MEFTESSEQEEYNVARSMYHYLRILSLSFDTYLEAYPNERVNQTITSRIMFSFIG